MQHHFHCGRFWPRAVILQPCVSGCVAALPQELSEDTLQSCLPRSSREITDGLQLGLSRASMEWTLEKDWDDDKGRHPWPFKDQGTDMDMDEFRAHLLEKKPTAKPKETIEPRRRHQVVRSFVFLHCCVTAQKTGASQLEQRGPLLSNRPPILNTTIIPILNNGAPILSEASSSKPSYAMLEAWFQCRK